ncbi:hypothetical protein PYW08_013242 [Mythimna loreyi]|uniref:Uncharacterized protein n=1 Tax=Mythimna loreyi TaxID=667449 RepID=A0ACC2QFH8_9NEOP|nr:hypothetical protein PYW08_013242 [Mythimna loreyi]
MYGVQFVLGVAVLFVGVVHSWDIAVSVQHQLIFYTNGVESRTVNLNSRNAISLVYDEVHNMMLYVDKQNHNDSICGYDLSSGEDKCFIKRNGRNIHGLAFDPVTDKIFFTDTNDKSVNFISKKRGSDNNTYGELLIRMDDQAPVDVAVDSCKGYIYWTHTNTDGKIEKVQFDGSDRKVVSLPRDYYKPFSLAIDPQTKKMFYFDACGICESSSGYLNKADFNGTHESVLLSGFYGTQSRSRVLTISKDYVYWMNSTGSYDSIWQFPKNDSIYSTAPKEITKFYNERILGIVAKYKIEEQIKGISDCDSLSSLIPIITEPHGEPCGVSVCMNYCLQGNCSVKDDGLPECSCNAGFTGGRCEISSCHGFCLNDGTCSLNEDSEPVCQCRGDYSGHRCEISGCLNYCMEGNCSFIDGVPKCSCNAGYSGERCQVSVCDGFCLNDGECSLNEEDEPVCQCAGNHVGPRCEDDITDTTPTNDLAKINPTLINLLSTLRKQSSKMYVLVEV